MCAIRAAAVSDAPHFLEAGELLAMPGERASTNVPGKNQSPNLTP